MERLFTPEVLWGGGSYDLWIQLRVDSQGGKLAAAEALWARPSLDGPYLRRDREPETQSRVEPAAALNGPGYGVATLPDGVRVPCVSQAILDDFVFEIPLNGLQRAWPGFEEWSDDVRQPLLDDWLVAIGREIFELAPFRAAVIGFDADPLDDVEVTRWAAGDIPQERWQGVLVAADDDLAWYPATQFTHSDNDAEEPPGWELRVAVRIIRWSARLQLLRGRFRR